MSAKPVPAHPALPRPTRRPARLSAPASSRGPVPARRLARLGGWLVVAPLAGLAGVRASGAEAHPSMVVTNAATPFAYLPAWAVLGAGLVTRQRALVGAAGALVVAHLVFTLPELRPRPRPRPSPAPVPVPVSPNRTSFRVFSANLRFSAPDWTELAGEIAASGADVVLLQELTAMNLVVLRQAGAFDGYRHELVDPRPRSFGSGIWSRHTLSEVEVWDVAGLPMTRAAVDLDGTGVSIVNVHTRSPFAGGLGRWKAQLRALAEAAATSVHPVVMAGDFNATYGNRAFRALLNAGLRDVHVEVGRGLAVTWPQGRWFPPLVRLDHVLVSPGLRVLDAREGHGRESDHRPVVADLALVRT